MKRWNYRVVLKNGTYAIYECFYDIEGSFVSISETKTIPIGESFIELQKDFELMTESFRKPILKYEDFIKEDN